MDETSITTAGVIDTFLVLLIGVGPKLALVPFLQTTAALDRATRGRVQRRMLSTPAVVAVALMLLGELLRALLHFTIGSLSIAGGVILLILAVSMVWPRSESSGRFRTEQDHGVSRLWFGRAGAGDGGQAAVRPDQEQQRPVGRRPAVGGPDADPRAVAVAPAELVPGQLGSNSVSPPV